MMACVWGEGKWKTYLVRKQHEKELENKFEMRAMVKCSWKYYLPNTISSINGILLKYTEENSLKGRINGRELFKKL